MKIVLITIKFIEKDIKVDQTALQFEKIKKMLNFYENCVKIT